jgi:hypothetical protein
MLYQGLYPFVTGEYFNLVGQQGLWMDLAVRFHVPAIAVLGVKSALGAAWAAGVLGLWAGDGRAYPLALLAAAGSLLFPVGPVVMGVIGLVCLLVFRETDRVVPA